ncbi:hypothetical protein Tco_1337399 [Tanacetum coccineum]
MVGEDEFHDDNPPPPPPVTPTQQTPHTLSTIKLPIPKKGEHDIWAMKVEHYLGHTDYPIWEIIQKGNGPIHYGAVSLLKNANQKFLVSYTDASLVQVSLIMRTKPGVYTLSFDDLYNNLRVFESDVKGSTTSSSSTPNIAFVSS